jgi:competence protein ComEC
VAASVIFGVHATPPPYEIREVFRRAGTIHLLVVSGALVSMVFALVFLPGLVGATWRRMLVERQFGLIAHEHGRVRLRPGLCAAMLAVGVVIYYATLTEGGPAVARAAVMGVLTGIAIGLRRMPAVAREHGLNVDYYTILAAAGLVLLAATPEALFYPGFQLSFAAVWAILYVTPKALWLVGWLPRWIGYTVVGTVAAQLATFPILAYHYGQAPIAGFAANILAVPLAAVVLVSGMATCALGVALPWLASIAGWICGHATRGMIWTSATFASLPGAAIDTPRPGALSIILWFAGLIALGVILGRLRVMPADHKEPPSTPTN